MGPSKGSGKFQGNGNSLQGQHKPGGKVMHGCPGPKKVERRGKSIPFAGQKSSLPKK
jgi:hypothetical protein